MRFDNADEWAAEFAAGAALLGFTPTPQQWLIASALNAHHPDGRPIHRNTVVEVPRRAGKTTAVLAVALGRCSSRPNYVVLFTAQSGTKARDRFLDMARTLTRRFPNEWERGFRILKGAGHMVLEFTNGSLFQVVPPKGESFRGDAGDLILLDEAQEHDPVESADLKAGYAATMDTRPQAQLVVAGTTGKHRSGLFWDMLERGRAGKVGIVEFAVPDHVTAADLLTDGAKDWAKARPLVEASHPGIGTLTDLETMQERFEDLPLPQFCAEYLGMWPEDYSRSAIDQKAWRACALPAFVPKPERFALAYDVAPDGSSAAIAAAWRDEEERPHIEVIVHRPGSDWLADSLLDLSRRLRVVIGHDTIGAALVESETLRRKRPAPRLKPMAYKDVGAAHATFEKALNTRQLRHFDDPGLNAAVASVVKRPLTENAWAWNRRATGADITPLVACTIALRTFDTAVATQGAGGNRMIRPRSAA
jgi:phage terminase large subunit-like protein